MEKISLFVPKEEMLYQAHNILQEKKYDIADIRVVKTTDTIMEARKAEANGTAIIIARGLQAFLIKQQMDIPVVEIVITAQEMALLVTRAKDILKKERPVIAVVGFYNMFCDMTYFESLFQIELKMYLPSNNAQLEEYALKAIEDQADLIIGGDLAVGIAEKHRVPSLFLATTEDSLRNAFETAQSVKYAMEMEKKSAARIGTILDYTFGGMANISREGMITAANPGLEGIIKRSQEEIVGLPLKNVFQEMDETKILEVLEGESDTYSLFMQPEKTPVYAILAPVRVDGRNEGAVLSLHKMKKLPKNEHMEGKRKFPAISLGQFSDVLQQSEAMKDTVRMARLYSQSEKPVLLLGETGTEKNLIAQCIHNNSPRNDGPFVEINCDGVSWEAQTELIFGRKGAAVAADGGTLFIHRICHMGLSNQFYLYQMITRKAITDIAESKWIHANVRMIATANQDLEQMTREGRFMEELFYLFHGLVLEIPPLRKRPEDLKQKFKGCFEETCEYYNRYYVLTSGAWKKIMAFPWRGNQLQIEMFCERLVLSAGKRSIDEIAISKLLKKMYSCGPLASDAPGPESSGNLPAKGDARMEAVAEPEEKRKILRAMETCRGNRSKMAAELGISKTTLWRKIKQYEIE